MPFITRAPHGRDNPYVPIDAETIRDLSDDPQALGMLVFILGKCDAWRVRPRQLAKDMRISERATYRIIGRLIQRGYIERKDIVRRKDGRFQGAAIYVVWENRKMAATMEGENEKLDRIWATS